MKTFIILLIGTLVMFAAMIIIPIVELNRRARAVEVTGYERGFKDGVVATLSYVDMNAIIAQRKP